MRRVVLACVAVVACAFPAAALAAPPPGASTDPGYNFIVTRVLPNGTEKVLDLFAVTDDFQTEQAVRTVTLNYVYLQKTNNPAWLIVLYGPTDGQYWTDDDAIWNSTLGY